MQVLAFDPLTGKPAWNRTCKETVSADLLVAKGAEVSIHTAAGLGNVDKVRSLLEEGIDVNASYMMPMGTSSLSFNIMGESLQGSFRQITAMRDAYAAGDLHIGWATLDMIPLFLEGLRAPWRDEAKRALAPRLLLVAIAVGAVSGLAGVAFRLVLNGVQWLAFGGTVGDIERNQHPPPSDTRSRPSVPRPNRARPAAL
mgnify:CR=1 FL=1